MILKTEELYALTYKYRFIPYRIIAGTYMKHVEIEIFSTDVESGIKRILNEVEDAVEYIYTKEQRSEECIRIDISKVLLKDGVFTSGDKIDTKYFDFWGNIITAD